MSAQTFFSGQENVANMDTKYIIDKVGCVRAITPPAKSQRKHRFFLFDSRVPSRILTSSCALSPRGGLSIALSPCWRKMSSSSSSSLLFVATVGTSRRSTLSSSGAGISREAPRRVPPRKTSELRAAQARHGRSLGFDAPIFSPSREDDDDLATLNNSLSSSTMSTSSSSRRVALRAMLATAAAASCSLVAGGNVSSAIAAMVEPLPFEELGGVQRSSGGKQGKEVQVFACSFILCFWFFCFFFDFHLFCRHKNYDSFPLPFLSETSAA